MRRASNPTERLRAVQASRSTTELIESLEDSSPGVARAAVRRLAALEGKRAAAPLRERLLRAELWLVPDIAETLCGIGDSSVVALAIAGLSEEPYTRRVAAARALGVFADARAAGALRLTLDDEIAGVRMAALDALAKLGLGANAAGDCARLLSDRDAYVRIAAVRALMRTASRPGGMLSRVIYDQERLVRLEVARHLTALPEEAARTLLGDPHLRVREAAARAAGVEHVGTLALLLTDDPSGDVRRRAAQTLGSLGDARIAEVLIPGLEDRDDLARAAVVRALKRLLTRRGAMKRLGDELASVRPARRRATVYALAHLEGMEVSEDVSRLIYDDDPDVRLALIHTAGSLLPNPELVVRYLTGDENASVRNSAEIWLLRRRTAGG